MGPSKAPSERAPSMQGLDPPRGPLRRRGGPSRSASKEPRLDAMHGRGPLMDTRRGSSLRGTGLGIDGVPVEARRSILGG
jgi:hypothetical protein